MRLLAITDESINSDRALAECESAKRANEVADRAHQEAVALSSVDPDLAEGWADLAGRAAGLAMGHWTAAHNASPDSPAARQARKSADRASALAFSAAQAVRRD
jgi:hypothetical protein